MAYKNYSIKIAAVLLAGTALGATATAGSFYPQLPSALPPNPQPGVCYARVEIPAQRQTVSENVMVQEGYETFRVSEPQIRARQEKVLVKEAGFRYDVRQPSYKAVNETVMVRPAYERLSVVPPSFKTVTETIRMSQPKLVWKKGNPATLRAQGYKIHSTADGRVGSYGRGHMNINGSVYPSQASVVDCGATCEIWCLVEDPGQSASFTRRVLARPADVRRETIPAKFRTITKQVMADPGGVSKVPVPPQYATITVEDVVNPGGVQRDVVPPAFKNVARSVEHAPSRYEWREVVCRPGMAGYKGSSVPKAKSYIVTAPAHSSHSVSSYTGASSYGSTSYGAAGISQNSHMGQTPAGYAHGQSSYGLRGASSSESRVVTRTGPHYYGSGLPATGAGSASSSSTHHIQGSNPALVGGPTYSSGGYHPAYSNAQKQTPKRKRGWW